MLLRISQNISDFVNKVVLAVSAALIGVIAVVCIIQVFCRFVLNNSLSWSEEVMRYMFVWMIFLGTTITVKNGSCACIDLLEKTLKGVPSRVHHVLVHLLLGVAACLMTAAGIQIMMKTAGQSTAAVSIPWSVIYLSVPVSGVVVVIHCLNGFLHALLQPKAGEAGDNEGGLE